MSLLPPLSFACSRPVHSRTHVRLPFSPLCLSYSALASAQCTRELLQEYYASLVRTHSKGSYILAGTTSASSASSDSEMDWEDPLSRPPTPPPPEEQQSSNPWPQPSTILVDSATVSPAEPPPPPTVEQNMAYQAFRRQSDASMGRGQGSSSANTNANTHGFKHGHDHG